MLKSWSLFLQPKPTVINLHELQANFSKERRESESL